MRLPLALCIIMIHLHMEPSSTAIGWGSFGSLDVWRIFACVSINEVASVAVPLFFMISGYLFFVGGKWNGTVFTGKLRRRIHSLLVPYVLFCLLAAVDLTVVTQFWTHSAVIATLFAAEVCLLTACIVFSYKAAKQKKLETAAASAPEEDAVDGAFEDEE